MKNQSPVNRRNVLVIHGRCEPLRASVYQLLMDMDLRPLEWNQLRLSHGSLSASTFDIVRNAFEQVQAVIAILYGEEEIRLIPELGGKDDGRQPRPNVIFEVGMALQFKAQETILLQFGNIREWSDIAGINRFKFVDDAKTREDLSLLLRNAGCEVDTTSGHYLSRKLDFTCSSSNA
jgi:predicted nucleotide-binding protein